MVFDLLRLDGEDLTGRPLEERRARLEGLGAASTGWQVPAAYDDGDDAARRHPAAGAGGHGQQAALVALLPRPPHRATGSSSPHRLSASFVVGGWRPQEGRQPATGARCWSASRRRSGLLYRGRVGSGIAGKAARLLTELLADRWPRRRPFADEVPPVDARGTLWVRAGLVVEVDSHAPARNQRLRQPSYRGVRTDLAPEDLLR